jgi:hypothetical protein
MRGPKAPGERALGIRHITDRTCDLLRDSVTDLSTERSLVEDYVPSNVMSPPRTNDGLQVKTHHGNIGAQGSQPPPSGCIENRTGRRPMPRAAKSVAKSGPLRLVWSTLSVLLEAALRSFQQQHISKFEE